jgi:hypothetical protein
MRGRTIIRCTLLGVVWATVCTAAQTNQPQVKKLTLHAPGATPTSGELRLLPTPEELTDADAFPLYQKAVESLPKGLDRNKMRDWRNLPSDQLPLNTVEALLRESEASLQLLEQAGKCKRCDWQTDAEGKPAVALDTVRDMAELVAVKARSEFMRGDYVSSVRTLEASLALARHLNTGPYVIDVLVGVAIGAVVYGEVEQFIQQPGAPSLEAALRVIPKPLFDENHSDLYGADQQSRDRAQLVIRRANRDLIALQYIETLRLGAAKTGQWPQTLDELKADLPNDPVTDKPFVYSRLSDTQATLEGPTPQGGGPKDVIRYELTFVK